MEMEGYLPKARQPKHCGNTPWPLCGWRGTYQQLVNQNTVAARLDYCVDGDGEVPTNCQATEALWQHALTKTLAARLDHSQATKTLAARLGHCVGGGVPTNSQTNKKTLWQHALATVWVERVPTNSQATAPWPQPENQNTGITPSPLCGWRDTYQQPGNQNTDSTP